MANKMIGVRLDEEDMEIFEELRAWAKAIWPSLKLNDAQVMKWAIREMHYAWQRDPAAMKQVDAATRQKDVQKKMSKRLKKLADDQGAS